MVTTRPPVPMPEDTPTARTLADFEGRWQLRRRIRDFGPGPDGTFVGEARLTPGGPGLRYEETGLLTLGGARVEGRQSYLWHQAGEEISVSFPDGRFFHRIGPGPAPGALHLCDPDTYRGAYDFRDWPVWTLTWRVTGPRKDYESVTTYSPCDPDGAGAEPPGNSETGTEDTP